MSSFDSAFSEFEKNLEFQRANLISPDNKVLLIIIIIVICAFGIQTWLSTSVLLKMGCRKTH